MKIKFQPMLWLTIVTLICLVILLSLGTWQYKRLIWKTDVLVQIDSAANSAPLTSLAQINELLSADKPVDFRRIRLKANFAKPRLNNGQPFHLMRSNGHYFAWRLYQPISNGPNSAYVATREFLEEQKNKPPMAMSGAADIAGYVRLVQPANRFTPKSDPKLNRWFAFNSAPKLLDWAGGSQDISTLYYIDMVEEVGGVTTLPVRKPELANNHLDYMLTWYSFALILLIIYALLHIKQGRLRIER